MGDSWVYEEVFTAAFLPGIRTGEWVRIPGDPIPSLSSFDAAAQGS
jgi:hypothetical protein